MYSRIWSVSKLRDVLIFILFNQFKNWGRKKETEPGLMIQVKMSCTLRTRDIPTTFWNNQLCFKKACTKTSWLKYEMNFDKPSCYVSPCCSYLYRLHTSLHYTAKNWKSWRPFKKKKLSFIWALVSEPVFNPWNKGKT